MNDVCLKAVTKISHKLCTLPAVCIRVFNMMLRPVRLMGDFRLSPRSDDIFAVLTPFQDNLSVPFSRVKQDRFTLEDGTGPLSLNVV